MNLRVLQINKNSNQEFDYLSYDLVGDRVGEVLSPEVGQYCFNRDRSIYEALEILKEAMIQSREAMIQSRLEAIQRIQTDIDKLKELKVSK
jgi:hypothetical protein